MAPLARRAAATPQTLADQVIDILPSPFLLLDRAQRILRANAALERSLGRTTAELAGRPFSDLVAAQDHDRVRQWLASALTARTDIELQLPRPESGPATLALTATPVEHNGEPAVLIAGLDLSEQRQLESRLLLARKSEAIGRLARGVAHDFNNTLAAVLSYAELILMDSEPGDPRNQDVITIRDAAMRAAELTRQMLVFSRSQGMQRRTLDLNALVLGLDKLLRRVIGEDVELVTLLGDGLPMVEVDPGRVEADLVSSVVTALESVQPGGSITIQTIAQGDTVRLAISHGGGPGVTIELPRSQSPVPPPEAATPARGTETVVVAEDNDMVRRGISAMLSSRGFTVLAAAGGEEAIALVRSHPEVRLVLADVVMPKMTAAELDVLLHEAVPGLRIVFMSGYAEDAVSRGIVKPAGFIQKPFSAEALARKVRDVLDS